MSKLVLERDRSIDFLRSIACIAVVLMHVVATFWYSTPVRYLTLDEYYCQQKEYIQEFGVLEFQSAGWYVCSLIDALTRFSVPCFVMISGALVLNKERIPMVYLWTKFKHVVKIVVLWGCIIGLLTYISARIFSEPIMLSLFVRTMVNGNGVFWFLYMLLPLYIASPVFKVIISNKETGLLFVVLWLFLSIILPFVKVSIPSLTNNVNLEYMNLFSAYSGYYTVGGILYNGGWGGHILKNRKIVFISVLVSLMFVTILQPSGLWHNFTNPFCACISIFVFCLILRYKPGKHLGKLATIFAKQTLGIYGLHIFFLKTIKTLWHPNAEIWIVQIVLYFILILALSFFMSKLLKVIPFLRDI